MGKIFIMSGPSGAGKSTITKKVSKDLNIPLMISATTREPRPGEIDGKDYFFMSVNEFEEKIKNNGFLEYEKVHNNQYYGTLISEVEKGLEKSGAVILEIDTKGTTQLLEKYKNKYEFILVFCKTNSIDELKDRILNRADMPADILKKRLERAIKELEYEKNYNYTIINEDFEKSCSEFMNIIKSNL